MTHRLALAAAALATSATAAHAGVVGPGPMAGESLVGAVVLLAVAGAYLLVRRSARKRA